MEKLKRGLRRGCPDLWTESGGEDRIVGEMSAFEQLTRKMSWKSPMWETLAAIILTLANVKKKKNGFTLYGTVTESR